MPSSHPYPYQHLITMTGQVCTSNAAEQVCAPAFHDPVAIRPCCAAQVTAVPWWLSWSHVEALVRGPLTVPQPHGRLPAVLPGVEGFQGGFCATMQVLRRWAATTSVKWLNCPSMQKW
jgi:hypothetical protein